MQNLDLNLLKIFIAVYETRSVNQAAQLLDMSQPGLSTALARLRKILEDPLFIKSAKGMEPTLRARGLYEPVRGIVESIKTSILAEQKFYPETAKREFRIAMSDVGETIYMPLAMQKINETAPGISLRSVSLPPNQLHEAMDEGAVDLAAGYFPDIKTQRFLYRRIGRHSHACIIRAGHPLQAARLSLEQFTSMQHVAVEAPGRRHEVFDEFLASKRIHRSIALRTPHFMSLPMIIAQTDMIATVPQALADFFADTGRIRQIGLPFVPPTFQANMYWNRSAHLDPANVWLRQTLFSAFQVVKSRAYDRNGVPAG